MLVNVLNNKVAGIHKISSDGARAMFLAQNPTFIESDFVFQEDVSLYEYNGNTFVLVQGWEALKAAMESDMIAVRNASRLKSVTQRKHQELVSKSSEIEEGGITVNGLEVNTDRSTQALLNGAFAHAGRNPTQNFSFKGKKDWTTVDKVTIDAVNDAVGNHVRLTFDNEKLHYDAIQAIVEDTVMTDSEKITAVEAYDISIGW